MLAILADIYSPLLALFCVYYLKTAFDKKFVASFVIAYFYVYGFAYVEFQYGWWASVDANFSSHTAGVFVMVAALLAVNNKVGAVAFLSLLVYGVLMTTLNYHSWFDIFTTLLVCLPCWLLFIIVNRKASFFN
jgi:hypothetical protein